MKRIRRIILSVALLICANIIVAQNDKAYIKPVPPRWTVERGFWVIETNIHSPKNSIIRFYTSDRILVYTEQVNGVYLNIKRKKTLKKLKRALDKVLGEWEKNGVVKKQDDLVALLKY